jgi:sulfur relay (sulfurtransferase) complex TusBCD TusD component (DsrE family)
VRAARISAGDTMHFAISTTWGPTDVTRGALPFIFAASALEAGDTVMIMLFHDAVTIALDGAHQKMVPFGPPSRFEEVFAHRNAKVIVCKPCAESRGITERMLVKNASFGGMNDLHAHASRADAKLINF